MARTAQTNIKIRNNGVPLTVGAFSILDLITGISATDAGGSVAAVSAAGGGSNIATEVVTAVQSGGNITLDLTTLAHTFVAIEVVFRNGQGITPVTSWSRSGNTITVLNADASEVFMVQYTY